MKKSGFTLVELLAVIAILAILAIIVFPNVLESFNRSKKQIFITDSQSIYKSVESYILRQKVKDSINEVNITFTNIDACGSGHSKLDLISNTLEYYIVVENSKVITFNTGNKDHMLNLTGEVKIEHANELSIVKKDSTKMCD